MAQEPKSKLFGILPATGYIRQSQLIGVPARKATPAKPAREATPDKPARKAVKAKPAREAVPGILPFSPATLWRKVAAGTFPAPRKLSNRVTAWDVDEIRAWMEAL